MSNDFLKNEPLKSYSDFFPGSDEDYASLNSTELILYDSTNDSWNVHVSAELPFPIYDHCAVNFEDKYIYLIGGISGGNYDSDLDEDEQEEPVTEDRTWVIDLKNLDFKRGPSLRMARESCQAAVMKSRDRMVIVVAGGRNGHDTLDSVEILDPESDEGWKPGIKDSSFDYAVVLILAFSKSFFEFRS